MRPGLLGSLFALFSAIPELAGVCHATWTPGFAFCLILGHPRTRWGVPCDLDSWVRFLPYSRPSQNSLGCAMRPGLLGSLFALFSVIPELAGVCHATWTPRFAFCPILGHPRTRWGVPCDLDSRVHFLPYSRPSQHSLGCAM